MPTIGVHHDIIEGISELDRAKAESARLKKLLGESLKKEAESREKINNRLRDNQSSTGDRLTDILYFRHNGEMEVAKSYLSIYNLYQGARNELFTVLQLWQGRGMWNSGIAAPFTDPTTHWVLYTGIAKGNLEYTDNLMPCFPTKRHCTGESFGYFSFKNCFKAHDGPMKARSESQLPQDESKTYYPSGLFDWSKVIPGLETGPSRRDRIIAGFIEEERGFKLCTFMAFGDSATELLLRTGSFYVASYGDLIKVDSLCSDNMQWCVRAAREELGLKK